MFWVHAAINIKLAALCLKSDLIGHLTAAFLYVKMFPNKKIF